MNIHMLEVNDTYILKCNYIFSKANSILKRSYTS